MRSFDYNVGTIGANVEMDTKGWNKGVNDLKSSSKELKKNNEEVSKGFKESNSNLGIFLGTLAASGIAIKKSISAFITHEDALDTFNNSFGKTNKQMQEWVKGLSTSSRRTRGQIMDMAGSFKLLFDGMGISNREGEKFARTLGQIAADAASYRNVNLEDSMMAVQAALIGSFEPMRKFGVVLSQTIIEQEAMKRGFAASKEELTDYAKVQTVTALLQEKLAFTTGNASASGYQFKEILNDLKTQFSEVSVEIGRHMADFLRPFLKLIGEIIRKVRELVETYPGLGKLLAGGTLAAGGIGATAIGATAVRASGIGSVIGTGAGALAGTLVGSKGKETLSAIIKWWKEFGGSRIKDTIGMAGRAIINPLGKANILGSLNIGVFVRDLQSWGDVIKNQLTFLKPLSVGLAKLGVVVFAGVGVFKFLKGLFSSELLVTIGRIISNLPVIGTLISGIPKYLRDFVDGLKISIKAIYPDDVAERGFFKSLEVYGQAFGDMVSGQKSFWESVEDQDTASYFEEMGDTIKATNDAIKETMDERIAVEKELNKELRKSLTDEFTPGKSQFNEFSTGLKNFKDAWKVLEEEFNANKEGGNSLFSNLPIQFEGKELLTGYNEFIKQQVENIKGMTDIEKSSFQEYLNIALQNEDIDLGIFTTLSDAIKEKIKEDDSKGFSELIDFIGNYIKNYVTNIKDMFNNNLQEMANISEMLYQADWEKYKRQTTLYKADTKRPIDFIENQIIQNLSNDIFGKVAKPDSLSPEERRQQEQLMAQKRLVELNEINNNLQTEMITIMYNNPGLVLTGN